MEEIKNEYLITFLGWLGDKGFINDRSWKGKNEEGLNFFSLSKNNLRVEIRVDWNLKYGDSYSPMDIKLIECSKETYSSSGYVGYFGQNVLIIFKKPITKELLDNLCEHYQL